MDEPHVFRSTRGIQPIQILEIGVTHKSQAEFESWLVSNGERFSPARYNLMTHNCNNFAHEALLHGLGMSRGVPQWVLDVPAKVMSSPMGQMLMPMLEQMQMPAPFSEGNNTFASTVPAPTSAPASSHQHNPWAHIPSESTASTTAASTGVKSETQPPQPAKVTPKPVPVVVATPLLDSHNNYLLSNDASAVKLCIKKLTSSLESSSLSPSQGDKQRIVSSLEILGHQLTASKPVPSPETARQSLYWFLNQNQPNTFAFMLMRLVVLHNSSVATSAGATSTSNGVMECLELVSERLTANDNSASTHAPLSGAPARTMAWCVLSNSFAQSSLVDSMLMRKKDELIDAALRDLSSNSRKEVKQSVTAFLYNVSLSHSKKLKDSKGDELPDYAIALLCGVLESIDDETCETSMFRRLLVAAAFVRCHNEIAGSLLVDLGYHEMLKNSSNQLNGKASQLAQEIVSMISA